MKRYEQEVGLLLVHEQSSLADEQCGACFAVLACCAADRFQPLDITLRRFRSQSAFPQVFYASPVRRACLSTPALCARQINPNVSSLALYDVVGTPGVAADISHINSKAQVKVRHSVGPPPAHK